MTDLQWGDRRHVEVDGVRFHVETAGPAAGGAPSATVVALHGFTSGTFTWAGIAPSIRRSVRLVAWDRPPFGRTERPRPRAGPDDPYGLEAQLRQTAQLVEALATGPVVLLGHSAGSLLAVQSLLAGTVDAAAAVLIAPALSTGPPRPVAQLARIPGADLLGPAALRLALRAATPVIRSAGRHATPLIEATAIESGRTLRRPGTAEALWHLTASWKPSDVVARLPEIRTPTTVIGGDEDRIVSQADHEAAAHGLGAELVMLAGVGHAAHEQVPAQVVSVLDRVLDDVAR